MRFFKLLFSLLFLITLVTIGRLQADETCQLMVFNRYCLGGDIMELSRREPDFIHQQREDERFALIYPSGRERDYVMAHRDRIYKVLRKFDQSTSSRYREWRNLLTQQYGRPNEQSRFPAHATGLAAKISAIQRGEGKALLIWYPEASLWHIELGWTQELGLHLAYIITQESLKHAGDGSADQ